MTRSDGRAIGQQHCRRFRSRDERISLADWRLMYSRRSPYVSVRRNAPFVSGLAIILALAAAAFLAERLHAQGRRTLGSPFQRLILAAALPEAPFHLRFFATPVKTDAQGRVITNADGSGT